MWNDTESKGAEPGSGSLTQTTEEEAKWPKRFAPVPPRD